LEKKFLLQPSDLSLRTAFFSLQPSVFGLIFFKE